MSYSVKFAKAKTFFIFIVLPTCLYAQNVPSSISKKDFETLIQAIHRESDMRGASFGISIYGLREKKPSITYNSTQSLTTGSSLKAITTATALLLLGADFRFETHLTRKAAVKDGVLNGDLYILGGGDPTLGSKNITEITEKWLEAVKKLGIREIRGSVIGYGGIFEAQLTPDTWLWEDIGNWYAAGACGLSIYHNLYYLYFMPSRRVGDSAKILRTEPEIPNLRFINEMKTGKVGSGDNGYIYGSHHTNMRYLRGTIPAGVQEFSIKGAVPDPAFLTAFLLDKYLNDSGFVTTMQKARSLYQTLPYHFDTIHSYFSEPLYDIIKATNVKSINLYAEAIFRMIGVKNTKVLSALGSTKSAAQTVVDFWRKKGVNMQGAFIEDGSGLSPYNALSTEQIAKILQITAQEDIGGLFRKTLPLLGWEGTLKYICRGQQAAGRIRAKSGYIKRVRAYVGYGETLSQNPFVFAVIVNNYSGSYANMTKRLERLLNHMVALDLDE